MDNDYVTLEEAENLLPKIRPILETIRRLKREIETIAAGYGYDPALLEHERPRLQQLISQIVQKVEKLEEMGCYVKDIDIGLIDFLSSFEGRDIFLCWKLGEAHITHWHEIGEGFPQRQPIVDLTQMDVEFWFEIPVVENEN